MNTQIVGVAFVVAMIRRSERALVLIDGFERPCCQVGLIQFLIAMVLDDAADFIIGDDLVKLPSGRDFDQEPNLRATEAQNLRLSGMSQMKVRPRRSSGLK